MLHLARVFKTPQHAKSVALASTLRRPIGSLPPCSHKPKPFSGPSLEQVMANRTKHMPPFYFHYYQDPVYVVEGHGQYLWDHKGNRFLDLIAGIATVNVGHSHPRITKVVAEQVSTLTHTSPIYVGEYQAEYSRMLAEELGPGYECIYLCNSGAEATDMAIYLARMFTGESKFLSLRNGYHGVVGTARSVTNVGIWNTPMVSSWEIEKLTYPNPYQSYFGYDVDKYLAELREVISANTTGKVAGFLFESIMGVGGICLPPPGYIPRMTELVKQHGGLVVCDEVQTGFGRIGKEFWAHRWQGIKPDIITMAKGIGNGFPLAAVATRREVWDKLRGIFFNTFGGGHVQSRVGMEVLKIIREEKLHENAEAVGSYLLSELKKRLGSHHYVGDIRGKGLMMGMELCRDRAKKETGKDLALEFMEHSKKCGLLFGRSGPYGNVIRLQPPLCMTLEDAKYVVEATEDIFSKMK